MNGLYVTRADATGVPILHSAPGQSTQPPNDQAEFHVSPDGARVVYRSELDLFRADEDEPGRFDLYVRPIDGSALALHLTAPFTSGSVKGAPLSAFTPDATRIVYRADHAENDVLRLYSSPLP